MGGGALYLLPVLELNGYGALRVVSWVSHMSIGWGCCRCRFESLTRAPAVLVTFGFL